MNSFEDSEVNQILGGVWIDNWESIDLWSYLDDVPSAKNFDHLFNEIDETDVALSSDIQAVALFEEVPTIPADIPTDQQEWLIYDSSTHRFRSPLLFEFIILLLQKSQYHKLAHYTDVKNGLFIIEQPQAVAELWQKVRNRQSQQPMTYDKFARAIRWYYSQDVFTKTNTRFTFQLSRSTLDRYCYDSLGRRTEIPEIQQNSTIFQLNHS